MNFQIQNSNINDLDHIFRLYKIAIHRIATNPDFRGQNLVGQIVEWVEIYAKENQK